MVIKNIKCFNDMVTGNFTGTVDSLWIGNFDSIRWLDYLSEVYNTFYFSKLISVLFQYSTLMVVYYELPKIHPRTLLRLLCKTMFILFYRLLINIELWTCDIIFATRKEKQDHLNYAAMKRSNVKWKKSKFWSIELNDLKHSTAELTFTYIYIILLHQ